MCRLLSNGIYGFCGLYHFIYRMNREEGHFCCFLISSSTGGAIRESKIRCEANVIAFVVFVGWPVGGTGSRWYFLE